MEPPNSFVGRATPEAEVVAALRLLGEGRERLVALRQGIGVVDVLGHPWAFRTPDLRQSERLLLEGATVYHNHPPEEDGSLADLPFSLGDLNAARRHRCASIVVVGRNRVFRMAPTAGGWGRCLGQGRTWESEFLAAHGQSRSADEQERLHAAWQALSKRRGLAYSREEIEHGG